MSQPQPSAWLVLPCMLLSLLITRFLTALFTSHNERGLSIVAKAALIFVATLVLTTTAATSLFQSLETTQPHTRNVLQKRRNVSPLLEERIQAWRVNTAPTLHWSSSSSDEDVEAVKQKLVREKKERRDEKSLRKRLMSKFNPRRSEMLGGRKETIEVVVREDPWA
ncbi:hypothetical protein J4E90_004033 [Alternaria incomplexa]|uniref:uncharacterized protein n=1 Tax=Alternaria incomplexa TaxID=1187928 RepID=UPI00221F675D|nr:uncharacterized protein J4E90_004033 [Alternaria incomplexa]KAI4915588.1 hypothetical protein J4E90_004033 [Alternaria incomplexa]